MRVYWKELCLIEQKVNKIEPIWLQNKAQTTRRINSQTNKEDKIIRFYLALYDKL